jgi:hypothetical protein
VQPFSARAQCSNHIRNNGAPADPADQRPRSAFVRFLMGAVHFVRLLMEMGRVTEKVSLEISIDII